MTEIDPRKFVALLENVRFGRDVFLVGIDGPTGAGKSAFASWVKETLTGEGWEATIISLDDFRKDRSPAIPTADSLGNEYDWEKLQIEVLLPLREGKRAIDVEPRGFVLVEGRYVLREELSDLFDFRIWVDAPESVRLRRTIQDGEEGAGERFQTHILPAEKLYLEIHEPAQWADFIVDGTTKGIWTTNAYG